ncbi:MAG: acyl-CoA thioesterase [Pseudomonadota bacterium]
MTIPVTFGDCDPAGLVFYPNFLRWFDTSFQNILSARGFDQRRIQERFDAVGTGVMDVKSSFRAPVRYGDDLTIVSRIASYSNRSFEVTHEASVDGRLCVEALEIRGLFAMRDGRLKALDITPIKALLEHATS